MSVTLAVLVAAVVAAIVIGALSRRSGAPDPVDPEAEERWLVRVVGRHPRLREIARSIDRHVIGGLLLVVALATVFATALTVGLVFDMVDRQAGLARWDRSVAAWGADNAASWSTNLLDRLTDLGGTTVVVVLVVAVAGLDYWRHRNANVILFLAAVLDRGPAPQQRGQVDRRPPTPGRPAPRRDRRLVVPVRALGLRGRGVVRRRPRPRASLDAARPRHPGGRCCPGDRQPSRRPEPCSGSTGSPTSSPV